MLRPVHIALFEVRRYIVDRGDLAFSLALPMALFALMYGVFGGDETFNGTANVVDLDGGPAAQEFVSRLESVDGLQVRLRSLDEADRALARTSILTAIVIPPGFSDALAAGEPVKLTVKQRGTGGDEGQIVSSIALSVAQRIAAEVQARRWARTTMEGSAIPQPEIDQAAQAAVTQADADPAVDVAVVVEGESGRADGGQFVDRLLPGILVMFLMFAVTLSSQVIVDERRLGTLERLLTTRLTLNQLFAGKFLAGVARAMLQAVVLLALAYAVLRVGGPSSFFQALAFALLVAAAVGAIGLVIGAAARTREQATWAAVFFTMFMTIFGGTFFDPSETKALDVLSHVTLNRYAIDALEGITSGGKSFADYGVQAGIMAGVAVAALTVARWAFRRTVK
ncbi:MAG: ABC transporter permease [SAR202 cluster bacterium]|nr:ABC transporter permease [SAR202 cluster bacterium]